MSHYEGQHLSEKYCCPVAGAQTHAERSVGDQRAMYCCQNCQNLTEAVGLLEEGIPGWM